MEGRYRISDGKTQKTVTLDVHQDLYHSLIYKPDSQPIDEFRSHVIQELSQYSKVGNLMPIPVQGTDNVFFIKAVIRDPFELGFETVSPPIHEIEWRYIREELLKGNLDVLDFEKNKIYANELSEQSIQLITPDFDEINSELISYLAKHPEYLQDLHWRKFEELLDTLFKAKGYETELGPGSGDGGVDIRMITRSDIEGPTLTLVQAKKYAEHRKIDLQPVQALYGVLESEKATRGLFVTTSSYLPSAKRFAESNPFRLQLAGPAELKRWLNDFAKRR
ncbi:MAG: restriction endonuclease [Candidatus Sedimenticola sp. (ex Thyasira tokunagai)]